MKLSKYYLPGLLFFTGLTNLHAIDLKQSKVTQAVNDVEIISANDQVAKPVVVNDVFKVPDILRTGKASRAELVAEDQTVTRVGSDTIFSFDPASRTIDLKQGSLLFHSPHGKGGGTIHTGSATASVLGTTLIVTTTANGGMKVLALEGQVEVSFLNKLKQYLTGGQMTFVLPGGKQLAPVIVFRLDELVKNSLLVKGFDKPLASLPLIQNQIQQQLKLIKSGRATDTGLLVGDKATPNQVEVLDLNTIQNQVLNQNVRNALGSDANIAGPSLTAAQIPTPPNRIFFNQTIALPGNAFFAGEAFVGFAGRNIAFNSPNLLTVDLTPYNARPYFDFVAAGNMSFNTSVTFNGLAADAQLGLVGRTGMSFAPNIALQANVADFEIASAGSLTFTGGSLNNSTGDIGLTSGDSISLLNTVIFTPGHLSFLAQNSINITWDASVYIVGDNNFRTLADDGSVTLASRTGSVSVNHTSIQTHFLTVNAADNILLDASGRSLVGVGQNSSANFTALNNINVNNTSFAQFGSLNMAANTVTLVNDTLAPISNFGTATGNVNVNSAATAGQLNLINCSWYHTDNGAATTTAITSANQVTLTSGPGTTQGIYSYRR
jgi:FecR protein